MVATTGNVIKAGSQGPLVNIIAWVFMVIMIMASFTKVANTWYQKRATTWDDGLLMLAMVVAIGQTVTVAEQVAYGLGQQSSLDDPGLRPHYEQAAYASQFLYVIALYLTKATTAFFTRSFAPQSWVALSMSSVLYGHLAWTGISLFVIAFQCSLPHPWAFHDNSCINMTAYWGIYAAVDIATDLFLIAVPITIVSRLQMGRARRVGIMAPFAIRLVTIPLIVLRVCFIAQAYRNGRLPDTDEVSVALVTEVHMHIAIVLTCAPFIKHVLDGMQGGAMTSDLVRGPAGVRFHNSNSGQHPLSNVSRSAHKKGTVTSVDVRSASTARLHDDWTQDGRSASTPSPEAGRKPNAAVPSGHDITVQTTITLSTEYV